MTTFLYKLFPRLKSITKRQKLKFSLLLLSTYMAIFGAYFKINDRPNSDLILGSAMIIQFISIVGSLSKWPIHKTITEV